MVEMNELREYVRELLELNLGTGSGMEYTAFVLDASSASSLHQYAPKGWAIKSHHMTLISPKNQKQRLPSQWLDFQDDTGQMKVVAIAKNDKVVTGLVDLGGVPIPMKGPAFPNVTIAINTHPEINGKAHMSNEFQLSDFEPIDPIPLTGAVEEIFSAGKLNENKDNTTSYVDALEDEIFEFLFAKSTHEYLQELDEEQEATVVLDTDIFDEFNNINDVHIGISVNSSGNGAVGAAYVCVPTEREQSNLVLTLDIPREYTQIDGFQDWLSAELADTLSHEIQHSCDTSDILAGDGNIPEGDDKWTDLESIERYYASEAETRGHVAGILGRSRRTGEDPESLLYQDISTIMNKAIDNGFSEDEMTSILQHIYNKWLERLNSVKNSQQK
jgi:hypothetical protein